MFRPLLLSVALCVLSIAAMAASPLETALGKLPHVGFPAPDRVASGRLQANDIAALKSAGIRNVIDLSVDNETPDFDEAAAVHAAGIEYHNLPIHGAQDLTRANVMSFDQLLTAAGNKPTLVHCASSNRVGAMIALRAAIIGGQSTEAALAEGRRWGLKSLEPAVRERLHELSATEPTPPSASTSPVTR